MQYWNGDELNQRLWSGIILKLTAFKLFEAITNTKGNGTLARKQI
jgi:hypothetical protein